MDDLTPGQRSQLEARLRDLARELPDVLARAKESSATVELDQQSVGRLTRVDALQRQAMAQGARRNVELRLEHVRAALAAIGRDEYGYCRHCEEPIGFARLDATPEAPFCLECQGRREAR